MPLPLGLRVCALVTFKKPFGATALIVSSFLTSLVNLLAAGRAFPSVLPHLCGATGGHRPIAVREVLCQLTSKCLASASRLSAISSLTSLQLGVGVKGGCEAIIHTTLHLLSSNDDPDQCWCLFLDFSMPSTPSHVQRTDNAPHNLQPGWNPAILLPALAPSEQRYPS